jgi:formylglycine-generating enzyme required for sulfatase activity
MADRITLLLLTALLGTAAPATAQPAPAPEPWAEALWNPKPLPDDLVLPLPCGGAMAFRPVPTPAGRGGLADRQIMLGQPDAETNYSEYLHQAFIAGPFDQADAPPRYYLAKYEVTRDQYAAVTGESCAPASAAGRLPQVDVAWHEAVGFTLRLSSWVARNARQALPKQEDALGFLRLPTEEEWEYAARGGAAVSEADFSARVFPMPEGMQRHVWFQGTRSAGGRARPVGMLEPNPLGLYDILGNVAEWVLEPYRLNKVGRPHGQAGGMVARGGDFQTPEGQVRSSLRIELPPLDRNGEPLRLRTLGLRPVLALVATTSDQQPAALREEFEKEAQSRSAASEDPAKLLDVLRNDTPDPALRQGIEKVGAALRSETRARREQESQAIRSQIEGATYLGRQMILASNYARLMEMTADVQSDVLVSQADIADGQAALAARRGNDAETRAALQRLEAKSRSTGNALRTVERAMRGAMAQQPERIRDLVPIYLRMILNVGRNADRLRIADEGNVVLQEMQSRNLPLLPETARVAIRHMVATSGGTPPTPEQVVAELLGAAPPLTAPATPAAPAQQRPPAAPPRR